MRFYWYQNYIAELYGCKNILEKIKEDKLVEILQNVWENKYKSYGEYNKKLLFRLLLLEQLCDIERFIKIEIEMRLLASFFQVEVE